MKKTVLLTFCMMLSLTYAFAQAILPFDIDNNHKVIAAADDIPLNEINTEQLMALMKAQNKQLHWVIIYTAGCSGTPYAFEYIKKMQAKYQDSVGVYLLSSNNYKKANDARRKLYDYGFTGQSYIINESYGKQGDERKKGMKFRNEISEECKQDIIGIPYHLIFDSQRKLVFHGYKGYKNTLPEDIISYFMDKR